MRSTDHGPGKLACTPEMTILSSSVGAPSLDRIGSLQLRTVSTQSCSDRLSGPPRRLASLSL